MPNMNDIPSSRIGHGSGVEMIKNIYGHYMPDSFSLQHCIISNNDPLSDKALLTISFGGEQECIFRIVKDRCVGDKDVIIHQSALEFLGLGDGHECAVTLQDSVPTQPEGSCRIVIDFMAIKNIKHWDSIFDADSVFSGVNWTSEWPKGISSEPIMKSLPMCMQSYILRPQTVVVVPILDSFMVFKILSCDGNNDSASCCIEVNEYCQFELLHEKVVVDDISCKEATQNAQNNADYDFLRPFLQQITTCLVHSKELTNMTLLPHSFLLTAPSGSGKSYILNNLMEQMPIFIGAGKINMVKGSCSRLSTKGWGNFSTREVHSESMEDNHGNTYQYLLKIISALDSRFAAYTMEGLMSLLQDGQLVVIIDDMDMVLRLFIDPEDLSQHSMLVPMNEEVRVLKYFGYYLQHMLREMSSSDQDYRIWVIGASSIPANKLPRSAKGSPEFERVVSVPKPSRSDRSKIAAAKFLSVFKDRDITLHSSTSDLTNIDKTELAAQWADDLAAITRGYLPADIQSVVNRAILMATGNTSKLSQAEVLHMNWKNILDAVASVPLKTLQNIDFLSQSQDYDKNYTWEDFAGYTESIETVKRFLRPFSQSNDFNNNALARFKLPRGMVLHGPSGCGKTLLAKIIAKQLKMNFLRVQSSDLLSKYFGQTEEKIRNLFQIARSTSPSLLFFDDFDALAHKRSNAETAESGHGSLHNRILSTFLNELDGISASSPDIVDLHQKRTSIESTVFVLAACKDLSQLDEALIRPGRLQYHVLLDYPSDEDIRALLQKHLANLPVDPSVDMTDVNVIVSGSPVVKATGATIESFCNQLRLVTLRDAISNISNGQVEPDDSELKGPVVTQRHFDEVLKNMFLRSEDFE